MGNTWIINKVTLYKITNMHKPIAAFSWSTPLFVVLIVQILTVIALSSSLLSSGTADSTPISLLPPLTFVYTAGDVGWIGAGRTFAHLLLSGMDIVVGACCIWYGLGRKLKIIRYVMMILGIYFVMSAVVNIATVGVIVYGGWWHVSAFAATVAATVAATASAVIFAMVQSNLRQLGVEHDRHIATIEQLEQK